MESIDYDFSKFKSGKGSQWGTIARTIILDRETQKYIDEPPHCLIINIGCGLCTRYTRLDLKQASWYNVDFEDVITLREKLLNVKDGAHNVRKSSLDETWPNEIPHKEDDNALIIVEGVFMYFTEQEIKNFITIIKKNFKKVTGFFEIMHTLPSKFTKLHDTVAKTNATFKWGIRHAKDLEKYDSAIKYFEEWHYYDQYPERLSFRVASKIDSFKNISNKIAHYEITSNNE
ncbi:hypothetical protein PIROE2DRAFT_63798 [Piromyces sp. E2]|nr:hypothetical protein PIROE2DRAFT_63798 [Piromyces sp. E2]|eukprot:OUM59404.1 hypothetical protein PIROE2DRAFT_63798 [Piromyces sp. E2]